MKPHVIIGIDPGTNCGWAVLDLATGARLASGTWNLKPRRHEGGGMRYVHFDRYFGALLATYRVKAVAYEEVRRHLGVDAAHIYGGIIACLGKACEDLVVPYEGVPVGTIKKMATGRGNASKEEMEAAANRKWPDSVPAGCDDEADALWAAETWRSQQVRK